MNNNYKYVYHLTNLKEHYQNTEFKKIKTERNISENFD